MKDNTQMTPEQELEALRRENEQKDKITGELERLWEMFPDATLENTPDEMWLLVEQGESLLGAYCITLVKKNIEEKKAQEKNRENSEKTLPDIKPSADRNEFFTREQVNKMSREQVRKNYDKIISSMKHWN